MRARTTIALGVLFFGALLGGCLPREGGDSGCPTCPGGGAVETVVPFETVDRGTQSGIRDARRLVIRDGAAWASLWREHTAGRFPEPPVPVVDFAREMVVAFFLGERPTGGYAVEISGITATAARLVVRVEAASPPPGLPVIQVLTQPYHLVRFPRSDLPVEFLVVEASPQDPKGRR